MNQILLVGCGNMGKAMLRAWLKIDGIEKIHVIQPGLAAKSLFPQKQRLSFYPNTDALPTNFKPDAIVLAVKPHKAQEVLKVSALFSNTLMVSVLAGLTTNSLSQMTESKSQWVRIMPNLPVQIDLGASLAFSSDHLSESYLQNVETLFGATGKLFWIPQESLFDSLTAISGCGPAYFFLMAETLVDIAANLGLEKTQARSLVQQTFLGSALLSSEGQFETLQKTVASKGGVTEAALDVLRPGLVKDMEKAISAALARLKELRA